MRGDCRAEASRVLRVVLDGEDLARIKLRHPEVFADQDGVRLPRELGGERRFARGDLAAKHVQRCHQAVRVASAARRFPIDVMTAYWIRNSAILLAIPQADMVAAHILASRLRARPRLRAAEKNIRPAQA